MDKYVARQPIKTLGEDSIIGYEVVFQQDFDTLYNSSEMAAADTIAGFLMQNTEKLFDEKLTFITFTPSLLFRNTPKIFDKHKLVIQLEDNVIIHPLATAIVKRYFQEGYSFAVEDFQFSPRYFGILEFVEYIKLRVGGATEGNARQSLLNLVNVVSGLGKKCIATGVNSKEEYDLAVEIGAHFAEGSYIAEVLAKKVNRIEFLQGNFFELVVEVSKDEPDIEEIEIIISRDTALTYALLKIVNSAYFALRRRVSSIRQALVTMGLSQLKQWVYLLSFSNDEKPSETLEELMKMSFFRANFASALYDHMTGMEVSKTEVYMMGMFSTLEYMIDVPLSEILDEIPIASEIKDALLGKDGICGSLYKLILEYENANWGKVKLLSEKLKLPSSMMAQIYMDCVDEVNTIWNSLTSSFEQEQPKPEAHSQKQTHT